MTTQAFQRDPVRALWLAQNPIRIGRLNRGWSIPQLASRSRLSRDIISRMERDLGPKSDKLLVGYLRKIAGALRVDDFTLLMKHWEWQCGAWGKRESSQELRSARFRSTI